MLPDLNYFRVTMKSWMGMTSQNYPKRYFHFHMALATNGVVITDAIKYVQGKMNHPNKIEKTKIQDVNEEL